MNSYPQCYVNEIVETQGKLFELAADTPSLDFEDFAEKYLASKTRAYLDKADAYLSNLDQKELFEYFCKIDGFSPKTGKSILGFAPNWIGQFYARFQWQKNISSKALLKLLPIDFVESSYAGLHDLDLDLAVEKVFKNLQK